MSASTLCMQAALGNSDIHEVLITPNINYVLVVLAQGTSQEQLQSIQPDYAKLKAAASYDQVTGMIVTCAGRARSHMSSHGKQHPVSSGVSYAYLTHLTANSCLPSQLHHLSCHIVLNI